MKPRLFYMCVVFFVLGLTTTEKVNEDVGSGSFAGSGDESSSSGEEEEGSAIYSLNIYRLEVFNLTRNSFEGNETKYFPIPDTDNANIEIQTEAVQATTAIGESTDYQTSNQTHAFQPTTPFPNIQTRPHKDTKMFLYREHHIIVLTVKAVNFKTRRIADQIENGLMIFLKEFLFKKDSSSRPSYERILKRDASGASQGSNLKIRVVEIEQLNNGFLQAKIVVENNGQLLLSDEVKSCIKFRGVEKLSQYLGLDVVSFENVKREAITVSSYFFELIVAASVFSVVFALLVSFIVWTLMTTRRQKNVNPLPANVALSECSAMQRASSQDSLRVFSPVEENDVDNKLAIKIENWINDETEKPVKRKYSVSCESKAIQTKSTPPKTKPETEENIYMSPIKTRAQEISSMQTQTDPYEWQLEMFKSQLEHTYETPAQTMRSPENLDHTYQSIASLDLSKIIPRSSSREALVRKDSTMELGVDCQPTHSSPSKKSGKSKKASDQMKKDPKSAVNGSLSIENEDIQKRRRRKKNRSKRKSKKSDLEGTTAGDCSLLAIASSRSPRDEAETQEARDARRSAEKEKKTRKREEAKKKKLAKARAELDAILGASEPVVFSPLYVNYKKKCRMRWRKDDDDD